MGWRLVVERALGAGSETMDAKGGQVGVIVEVLERRVLLDALPAGAAEAEPFDWSQGSWGIVVSERGDPESSSVTVTWPGGSAAGNSLEVYYGFSSADYPQCWAFLTNGTWRQVAHGARFGTSYALLRYYNSADQHKDECTPESFDVIGVTGDGRLELRLDYFNGVENGDAFDIHTEVLLDPPDDFQTSMVADITVTNAGPALTPAWQGHRDLAEQWELLTVASMYVADNLTDAWPNWYDSLDAGHEYVGIVDDADYSNDGFSKNAFAAGGDPYVPTHDVKRITARGVTLNLAHDEATLPHVVVPGYTWKDTLVLLDHVSPTVTLEALYLPNRTHRAKILDAAGLTDDLSELKWAVEYDRGDTNMVDGDNISVRLGMDDFLNTWPAGGEQSFRIWMTTGSQPIVDASFPFTIRQDGSGFNLDGREVFLNGIGYQPLEPFQQIADPIREQRVQEDLERWQSFSGGNDPVIIRVYAQPTVALPIRMPKLFYDGVRDLGFWILRDIYFDQGGSFDITDFQAGYARIDAVLAEVEAVGAMERIFAWDIADEFQVGVHGSAAQIRAFVEAMADYIHGEMAQPGRQQYSQWVTWASWPPDDMLFTDGPRVAPDNLDFYSYNAYSYEPDRIRDHQAGPGTGRPFAGYVAALREYHEHLHEWDTTEPSRNKPVLISEFGLTDSTLVALGHEGYMPWSPQYRKGGLDGELVAEGLAERYWDVRLSGAAAGAVLFEWNDEWHKGEPEGNAADFDDSPEECFGLMRFDEDAPGQYHAAAKLPYDTVRDLFAMRHDAGLVSVVADEAALAPGETTALHATASVELVGPLAYRWEVSRGVVIGDGPTAQYRAADTALGDAVATVIVTDTTGQTSSAQVTIDIAMPTQPTLQLLSLGSARAAGRVEGLDLDTYRLGFYIHTDKYYAQPYDSAAGVMTSIWVGADGYWWTPVSYGGGGTICIYAMPSEELPRTSDTEPDYVWKWEFDGAGPTWRDSDNDLLPDNWENGELSSLGFGRYDDVDKDGANNLEEFLAGRHPAVSDNDLDNAGAGDGLWDNWEMRLLGTLDFGPEDDPDGDGWNNIEELQRGANPTRAAIDSDEDGLPDRWELRMAGSLAPDPVANPLYRQYYEIAPLPGDADVNGVVDAADYVTLKRNFGSAGSATWEMGDFHRDGKTNFADLLLLMANFGTRSVSVVEAPPAVGNSAAVEQGAETRQAAAHPATDATDAAQPETAASNAKQAAAVEPMALAEQAAALSATTVVLPQASDHFDVLGSARLLDHFFTAAWSPARPPKASLWTLKPVPAAPAWASLADRPRFQQDHQPMLPARFSLADQTQHEPVMLDVLATPRLRLLAEWEGTERI